MKKITNHINVSQIYKIIYLLIVVLYISKITVYAQADPGGDPDSAPLDGGLSLLIAAGVGYGVKKLREKRIEQQEEQEK
jgi:hypothetical protein